MKKYNYTHFLMGISFGIIVLIWLVLMFWAFFPYRTATQSQPYIVHDKVIKQGELLQYEMNYCKYTSVVPTVERQFIDGIIFALPPANAQLPKGCGKRLNSLEIPHALPPGQYYLQATVSYKVNPIRIITSVYRTEQFEVIAK